MSGASEVVQQLAENDELRRHAHEWRDALATAAAVAGTVPFLRAVAPWLVPDVLGRGAIALWAALVLGWATLCVHSHLLRFERRRLLERPGAGAGIDDDPRS